MSKFGWPSAFYMPASITVVWCVLWWYMVADTPEEHPRISEAEKKYIKEALGDKVKKTKVSFHILWRRYTLLFSISRYLGRCGI